MATERQIEANRRNWKRWRGVSADGRERQRRAALRDRPWEKSTGPRSAEGKDKVSQNKPPGCPECPAWKWAEQRMYKFNDYLKALGIDAHKVKMIHVYGSKLSQTIAMRTLSG